MTVEHALTRRSVLRIGAGAGAALALGSGALPAWARPRPRRLGAAPARLAPVPRPPRGRALDPEDRAHRHRHDGEPLLRQRARDAPSPRSLAPRRGRAAGGSDRPPAGGQPRRDGASGPLPSRADGLPRQRGDAEPGTPATCSGTAGATTASCARVAPRRWASSSRGTCPSPIRSPRASRSGSATSPRCSPRPIPNRRFLFSGTASGLIATDAATFATPAANGTIFDRLDHLGISWRTYFNDAPSPAIIPGTLTPARSANFVKIDRFYADAAAGSLPAVSYVEPNFNISSQENPQDVQFGDQFLEQVVRALLRSPNWGGRRCSSTTTNTAASTTMSHRPRRSRPTTSRRSCRPAASPAAMTATASASR